VGDRYYLVDAGEGVGRQIRDAGLGNWKSDLAGPLDALRAVFITHMHSDHVVDLNNLLTSGISNGLRRVDRPVQVWGPGNRGALPPLFGSAPPPPVVAPDRPTPGTREMLDLLARTYATDYNDRARDARAPVPAQLFSGHDVPLPAELVDNPNGEPHPRMTPVTFYEDDRVRVSATLVQHAPVFPALAFRFDTEDGSVAFSGDTSPSDNLVEMATGADVLVHEAMDGAWAESLFPQPRDEVAEARLNHLLTAHTLIEQVGRVAERAGVATLVLNHLVPGYLPERRWREAQRGFSGRLVVGRDLDEIAVGRRTVRRPARSWLPSGSSRSSSAPWTAGR
jgi:ribonuclease BN (tRNA processing enzyme)